MAWRSTKVLTSPIAWMLLKVVQQYFLLPFQEMGLLIILFWIRAFILKSVDYVFAVISSIKECFFVYDVIIYMYVYPEREGTLGCL